MYDLSFRIHSVCEELAFFVCSDEEIIVAVNYDSLLHQILIFDQLETSPIFNIKNPQLYKLPVETKKNSPIFRCYITFRRADYFSWYFKFAQIFRFVSRIDRWCAKKQNDKFVWSVKQKLPRAPSTQRVSLEERFPPLGRYIDQGSRVYTRIRHR